MQRYTAFILCMILFLGISFSVSAQERGMAGIFPDKFSGRKTASGIIFSKDQLHAAHPKLAFGEVVTVFNPAKELSVKVKIVDRGPFIDDRIIELSSRAARDLGIPDGGEVAIYPGDRPQPEVFTKRGSPKPDSKPASSNISESVPLKTLSHRFEKGHIYQLNLQDIASGQYFIQIAALSDYDRVLQLATRLQQFGYSNVVIQADNRFIKVALGPYKSATAGSRDKEVLIEKGFKPIVIPW